MNNRIIFTPCVIILDNREAMLAPLSEKDLGIDSLISDKQDVTAE